MNKWIIGFVFVILGIASCSSDPDTAENILHYDDDNASSPIIPPGQNEMAIYFPSSLMSNYNGRELQQVEFFAYDQAQNLTLKVYTGQSSTQPGTEIYSQSYSGVLRNGEWNKFNLTTPLLLSSEAIWIGLRFQNTGPLQVIGCDAGPVDERGGDWLFQSEDGNWESFQSRTGESVNWNIRAVLNPI